MGVGVAEPPVLSSQWSKRLPPLQLKVAPESHGHGRPPHVPHLPAATCSTPLCSALETDPA